LKIEDRKTTQLISSTKKKGSTTIKLKKLNSKATLEKYCILTQIIERREDKKTK